jgi:hypothetical protein
METFIEYMKLHELSLLQDANKIQTLMDGFPNDLDSDEYKDLEMEDTINTGELKATRHLLSVAWDMM